MIKPSHSSNAQTVLPFLSLSLYRTCIATPLEGITIREILFNQSTQKIIRNTPFFEFYRGFQPNGFKFLSKTVVQISSLKIASSLIPSQLDASIRGIMIGILSAGMETSVNNAWNVFGTRFIQGQRWNIIKQEGPLLLTKGLSSALLHRALSGAVFWSVYEKLHQIYPDSPALTGTGAGIVQVCSTTPLYITKTLRQRKNPPTEPLWILFKKIIKKQGLVQGLFLPGLIPRLALTVFTSGPLVILLERHQIIQR
jgi:hypothetical protein